MCFRRLLQTSAYRYSFKVCAENRICTGIIGTVITALRTAARKQNTVSTKSTLTQYETKKLHGMSFFSLLFAQMLPEPKLK